MNRLGCASLHIPRDDSVDLLKQFGCYRFGLAIEIEGPGAWHPCPHDPVDTFLRLDRYPDHGTPREIQIPFVEVGCAAHTTPRRRGIPREGPALTGEYG